MVSKTKIHNSFLVGNFTKDWFNTLYRLDHDSNGRAIMLYVKGDIPPNLLAIDKQNSIESFYVQLNLLNEKWLVSCLCNPNKTTEAANGGVL